jgi:Tfp pilus assembly protein PilO
MLTESWISVCHAQKVHLEGHPHRMLKDFQGMIAKRSRIVCIENVDLYHTDSHNGSRHVLRLQFDGGRRGVLERDLLGDHYQATEE